jgi:hypothetical protein
MDSRPTIRRDERRTRGRRPSAGFRYSAVVTGTGEIQPIQEFLGRRLLRQIDPCSRTGRELLTGGRVCLWCESVVRGERLPVRDLLGRLRDHALREMDDGAGDAGWSRCCRSRLDTIESWQAFFDTSPTADS